MVLCAVHGIVKKQNRNCHQGFLCRGVENDAQVKVQVAGEHAPATYLGRVPRLVLAGPASHNLPSSGLFLSKRHPQTFCSLPPPFAPIHLPTPQTTRPFYPSSFANPDRFAGLILVRQPFRPNTPSAPPSPPSAARRFVIPRRALDNRLHPHSSPPSAVLLSSAIPGCFATKRTFA